MELQSVEHEIELAVQEEVCEACRVEMTYHSQHIFSAAGGPERDAVEVHVRRVERTVGRWETVEVALAVDRAEAVYEDTLLVAHLHPFLFLILAHLGEVHKFCRQYVDGRCHATNHHRLAEGGEHAAAVFPVTRCHTVEVASFLCRHRIDIDNKLIFLHHTVKRCWKAYFACLWHRVCVAALFRL